MFPQTIAALQKTNYVCYIWWRASDSVRLCEYVLAKQYLKTVYFVHQYFRIKILFIHPGDTYSILRDMWTMNLSPASAARSVGKKERVSHFIYDTAGQLCCNPTVMCHSNSNMNCTFQILIRILWPERSKLLSFTQRSMQPWGNIESTWWGLDTSVHINFALTSANKQKCLWVLLSQVLLCVLETWGIFCHEEETYLPSKNVPTALVRVAAYYTGTNGCILCTCLKFSRFLNLLECLGHQKVAVRTGCVELVPIDNSKVFYFRVFLFDFFDSSFDSCFKFLHLKGYFCLRKEVERNVLARIIDNESKIGLCFAFSYSPSKCTLEHFLIDIFY